MIEQRRLAQTFVELADTLVADFDIVDFLFTLASRCAELFDAAEAGVMLGDQRGGLRVVASSNEQARLLELFELQNHEGPCLDCYHGGAHVVAEDLNSETRWPLFTAEAISAGFQAVDALALRCQDQVIGALNLFRPTPGPLSEDELAAAQAMADVATIGILQQRAAHEARVLVEQLQSALNSRVEIEQAKGVLAERAQINMDESFNLLRKYARNHNFRLGEVALMVIAGSIAIEDVTQRESKEIPQS